MTPLGRVYGLVVSSELPLEGLSPVEDGAASDIRVSFASRSEALSPQWFSERKGEGGEAWLSIARTREGFLVRVHGLADFTIDRAGKTIALAPSPDAPRETLRHVLLDVVLPLVLNLRGGEALHATAVATASGVCAFTGRAGAGKSTLAASFLLAGHEVVCDDCLVLSRESGRFLALPGHSGLRLRADALAALAPEKRADLAVFREEAKPRLVPRSPLPAKPLPLAAIYALVRGAGEVSIEPFPPGEGLMSLVESAHRLDVEDRAMLARQLRFLKELAGKVPVRRLRLPDDLSRLDEARLAVLEDIKERKGGGR